MAKKNNIVQYLGTGRRKKAVARVFLRANGTGNIVVNGKELKEYMPSEVLQMVVRAPLELTNTLDQFDVLVNVQGWRIHWSSWCNPSRNHSCFNGS